MFGKTRGASQIHVAQGSHVRDCNDLKLKDVIPFRNILKTVEMKVKNPSFQIKKTRKIYISTKNKKKQVQQTTYNYIIFPFFLRKTPKQDQAVQPSPPSSHWRTSPTLREPLPQGFGCGRGGRGLGIQREKHACFV